jgi:peptide/nickel transport system substrate-binding protein/oligopeptide transport system substrate-binding protein
MSHHWDRRRTGADRTRTARAGTTRTTRRAAASSRLLPAAALALLLAAALVAVALLAACGSTDDQKSGSAQTGTEPQPGGTYNFPLGANPVYLDPLNGNYESEGTQVQHQVFEGLVQYVLQDDGGMKAEPKIAESFTVNDDATVFTFTIRKGVMFQPPVSREVTAQDVVDSWTRVTDPRNESLTSYILAPIEGCGDDGYQTDPQAGLTGVRAVDDSTLEVTLRYPFAEFPQTLGHAVAAVQPVDYVEKVGAKAFNRKPVGTGPYMLETWKANRSVDLVRSPGYWDKQNAGYVDRIHMPIISDLNTQWLEFKKGTIDFTPVPPGQVKAAENDPKVKSGDWVAKKWPSLSTYFIGFNMTDKVVGYSAGEKGALLREALTYVADRAALINIVNEGVPLEGTGIVPVGVPGYTPDQSPFKYDPEKAKELISQYGKAPTLQYWYITDQVHQKNAEALQAGWKAAGVETELSNFEFGTFLDKLSKGDQGDQLFASGWVADYPSMDNFLYSLFQSDNSGPLGSTFYSNEKVDEMLVEARGLTDDSARQHLYAEIERVILADAPIIPIYYYRDFRVMSSRVQGQVLDPMYFVDMWKVWVTK